MGMFDRLRVRYPLPNPDNHRLPTEFQTKSLACQLDTYELREDGILYFHDYRYAWTGAVRFYGSGVAGRWHEYVAYFRQGKLDRVIEEPEDDNQ